jgi:hypothetical protein
MYWGESIVDCCDCEHEVNKKRILHFLIVSMQSAGDWRVKGEGNFFFCKIEVFQNSKLKKRKSVYNLGFCDMQMIKRQQQTKCSYSSKLVGIFCIELWLRREMSFLRASMHATNKKCVENVAKNETETIFFFILRKRCF